MTSPAAAGDVPGLVPAPPVAGEFTNADLLPAVARMVGVDVGDVTADPVVPQVARDDLRGIVLLVVDGLGWHQLATTSVAPFLRAAARNQDQPSRSVLPSTTTTNLVSIGTGRHGGDHGILGYTMVLDDTVFNTLVWRDGLRGGGADARDRVVPEALVPRGTMLERLLAADVTTAAVLHPDFLDSGLTRAGLRGGQRLAAVGLTSTLRTAIDLVTAAATPAVVYTHHPHVDKAGHAHGPHTPEWDQALAEVDSVVATAVADLPRDVALVVTADHGMVAMDDDDLTSLADGDPLLDGVRLVAGEPRMRTLVVDEGVDTDAVAARFAEVLGDRATVRTTTDAVAVGWFGPTVPDEHARRLGDVVVASHVGSVPHERVDPHRGRLPGMHGALTAAERDIPLLVLTADHA